MQVVLAAMIAIAFIAGGAGGLIWVGNRDSGTSWYPWPSRSSAAKLLTIAAGAGALAIVTWIFTTLT